MSIPLAQISNLTAAFQSFTVAGVNSPMYFLRDEYGAPWVDLRSVLTALRVGWQRWGAYFRGRSEMLGLRPLVVMELDSPLLATPLVMITVLDHLRHWLPAGVQARRLQWFCDAWAKHWQCARAVETSTSGPSSRKLTPDLVLSIYTQTKANRTSPQIARELQISESTVRLIRSGTYKSMDDACRSAWTATFGGQGRYSALLEPAGGRYGA